MKYSELGAHTAIIPGSSSPVSGKTSSLLRSLQYYWSFDAAGFDGNNSIRDLVQNRGLFYNNWGSGPPIDDPTFPAGLINACIQFNSAVGATTAGLSEAPGNNTGTDPMFHLLSDRTYSFWFNYSGTAAATGIQAAIDGNAAGSEWSIIFDHGNNNIQAYVFDGLGGSQGVTASTTAGVWHHFVFVYNGTSGLCTFYLDNVVAGTFTQIAVVQYGAQFSIGAEATQTFNDGGQIDEFGIWNRQLSAAEVNKLYNGGAGRQYPF